MVSDSSNGIYRSVFAAIVGLAIVAMSLGLGAFVGALYAPHYGNQSENSANGAARTEQRNPTQIDRDRAGLPYIAERIASASDPQSADEREKRDLAAQEAAALWGFWILCVSAVGTAITMVGTGLLLWQIMLTREAVTDTGDATKAMVKANEIAITAQRPYLHPEKIGFEKRIHSSDNFGRMILVIKNFGATPATDLTISAGWSHAIGGEVPSVWRLRDCPISHELPQNHIASVEVQRSDARLADIVPYFEHVACKFEIRYKDKFGNDFAKFETYIFENHMGTLKEARFFSSP